MQAEVLEQIDSLVERLKEAKGEKHQIMICMEECAELIQAISKIARTKSDYFDYYLEKAVDEMADVAITMRGVQKILGVSDAELESKVLEKLSRTEQLLEFEED